MLRNRLSGSGRAIERQPVFEMRLAAEGVQRQPPWPVATDGMTGL